MISSHIDIIILHVNIIVLHVDIDKSHVNVPPLLYITEFYSLACCWDQGIWEQSLGDFWIKPNIKNDRAKDWLLSVSIANVKGDNLRLNGTWFNSSGNYKNTP